MFVTITARAALIAGGLVFLLFGAVAFTRSLPPVTPASDMALMDIHQISVARHLEGVGSYSRFGWRHPGPLYAMLQLPIFWLSDYRHLSTATTAVLMNVSAVLAAGVLLYRRARTPALVIAAAIVAGSFVGRVPALLANPWNPLVPILLIPLLLATAAASITSQARYLSATVALASLIIQAHVGFAVPVLTVVLLTFVAVCGSWLWPPAGAQAFRANPRELVAPVLVGVAAWYLPIWDAFSSSGSGNLQQLYTFFIEAEPHDPRLAAAAFVRYFAVPFTTVRELPGGAAIDPNLPNPQLVAVQAILLVGSAMVFTWRRRPFEAAWSWLIVAASAASYAAILRLPEVPLDHTVFWVSVLGVMSWSSILACLGDWAWPAQAPGGVVRRYSPWVAGIAAAAGLTTVGVAQVSARIEIDAGPNIRALAFPIRAALVREGARAAKLEVSQDRWSDVAGVAFLLYRDGFDLEVSSDWVWMFGPSFAPTGRAMTTFRLGHDPGGEAADGDYQLLAVVSATPIYVRRYDP